MSYFFFLVLCYVIDSMGPEETAGVSECVLGFQFLVDKLRSVKLRLRKLSMRHKQMSSQLELTIYVYYYRCL